MSSTGTKAFIAIRTGSNLKTGNFVIVTGASGGVPLAASGTTTPLGVVIKNASVSGIGIGLTGSGIIHIGSSGNPPYASGGYILLPGETETFYVNRADWINVFSKVSGAGVVWYGIE